MKKLKNVISVIAMALVLLVNTNISAQNIDDLSNDRDFKSYIVNQLEFIKKSNVEIITKIGSKIIEDKNDMELFYKALSTNEKEYKSFINIQDIRLKQFSKKFNLKSYNEKELNKILETETKQVFSRLNSSYIGGDFCKEKYNNDLAINFASAVVAHLGCVSLDITLIAGLVCHAAVTLGHTAADNNAAIEYYECLKN